MSRYGALAATYYQTYGSSAMDLICNVDRTSSPVRNGTFSLVVWLERPDDSIESRVCNDFGSSERHVLFSRKEGRLRQSLARSSGRGILIR